jgi:O-antigen/teichoic acid export membrane protein
MAPPPTAEGSEGSRASLVFGRGLSWAGLSSLAPRAISILTTLLLAALLTPKDFGYLAIVNIVVALVQSVFTSAFTPALVQLKGDVEELAATALSAAVAFSGLIYCALFFAGPAIESFYKTPHLSALLRVSAISILAGSVGAAPLGILQRRFAFKRIFVVQAVSQIAGAGLSLALAFSGFGVWALILGPVVNSVTTTVLAFFYARWTPRFRLDFWRAGPFMGFSSWVIVGGIQTWLFLSGDNAIASRSFDAATLGVYALGFNLANLLPGIIASVVSLVAYPSLCQVQRDPAANFSSTFLDVQTVVAALALPAACLTALLAGPLIGLGLRSKWADLGFTIQWLAIFPGLCNIWSLNSDGYRAVGQPGLWPKLSFASLVVLLPCLTISARYGFHAFTITRCLAALPLPVLNMIAASKALRVPLYAQISRLLPSIAASAALWLGMAALLALRTPSAPAFRIGYLAMCTLTGLGIYLAVLRIAGPRVWECGQQAVASFLYPNRKPLVVYGA